MGEQTLSLDAPADKHCNDFFPLFGPAHLMLTHFLHSGMTCPVLVLTF